MRQKKYGKGVYRSLSFITQFGINMLVPIGIMSYLGYFLDERLNTNFLMVIFFFLGAIAGFQNIYRMSKSIFRENTKHQENKEQREHRKQ